MALNMYYSDNATNKILKNPNYDPNDANSKEYLPGYVASPESVRQWGEDKLGLTLQTKLLETKNLALSNPNLYMQKKQADIKAANKRIGDIFEKTYYAYAEQGLGDQASKEYALRIAKSQLENEKSLLSLKYPDFYTATAEDKNRAINILKGV